MNHKQRRIINKKYQLGLSKKNYILNNISLIDLECVIDRLWYGNYLKIIKGKKVKMMIYQQQVIVNRKG